MFSEDTAYFFPLVYNKVYKKKNCFCGHNKETKLQNSIKIISKWEFKNRYCP